MHSGCIRGRVGGGERYQRRGSREATIILGSLSTRVFETRTATGSEVISLLTYPHTTTFTLLSIFSPLKISSRKIWGTLWSKHAKCPLPVVVRVYHSFQSTTVCLVRFVSLEFSCDTQLVTLSQIILSVIAASMKVKQSLIDHCPNLSS